MKVSTGPDQSLLQGADGIFPANCPSRTVLDHVSSKWGVLILVALWNGPQRWSELRRRAEGISEKMLAQTLKTLEGDGFLRRDAQPVIPPRVDYSLTDRGRELVAVLLPLVAWIAEHASEIVDAPARRIRRSRAGSRAVTDLDLDVRWYAGTPSRGSSAAPPIQVHMAAPNTVLLRQSIAGNFEAPFLYLLFGEDRAFLLDTGATADATLFPLRATVDTLIDDWLSGHPQDAYELIVAHSHAHGDHVAGDGQFTDRPHTRVVGHSAEDVAAFFGIGDWPRDTARLDLGGRVLEVIPTPGHHPSAVAIYDGATGTLLTGDTVYPGRLYVQDFPAFQESLRTLCDLQCRTSGPRGARRPHRNADPARSGTFRSARPGTRMKPRFR